MTNVFNINRFGKYFLYDLKNTRSNFLISLIILGCLPVITFFFMEIFDLLLNGAPGCEYPMPLRVFSFAVSTLVTILVFPVKVYGGLTDKRRGSDWVLLPASTTEKFISMFLMSCVVVPVALYALLFGTDWLLSIAFPSIYGTALISTDLVEGFNSLIDPADFQFNVNVPAILACNWISNMLVFLLGAVCFKKSKVAKTFLVLVLVSTVISSATSIFFAGNLTSITEMIQDMTPDSFFTKANIYFNVANAIEIGALLAALYYRLRTIKH